MGRYTGEWKDGKYHGQGLFKREILVAKEDEILETDSSNSYKTQIYDG